jgi:cation diffusion facilitator CzcD-associated flavoprotein CzcO
MSGPAGETPVIIVGAGPAGLAAGACLARRGITPVLLEAGDALGDTWRTLYDRLHLHTIKRLSGLPGYPMPRRMPRYPSRAEFVGYLAAYAERFKLRIEAGSPVTQARRGGDRWILTTPQGERSAGVLVSATGIFRNPERVIYPGQDEFAGRIVGASAYKNPAPFAGQRVLVVGSGNTGAEIAVDLAEQGVETAISIRAGANVVPRELLGIPIQVWAHIIGAIPRPVTRAIAPALLGRSVRRQARAGVPRPAASVLESGGRVPVIGLALLEHARRGTIKVMPGIERFTADGVRFADGREAAYDAVILATGYRPALDYLASALPLDAGGRPRVEGVRALDAPDLYFVGLHYDFRGTLYNIAHEAPEAARLIAARLKQRAKVAV